MNTTKIIAAVLFASGCLSFSAFAGENISSHEIVLVGADTEKNNSDMTDDMTSGDETVMAADTIYEMDLEGDGKTEQIFYKTYEKADGQGNSSAVLEIYLDGELFWSYTDPAWSYYWELSHFSLSDGTVCFLAVSRSDNDWNPQALILTKPEGNDTFSVLGDITQLTRQSEENPENLLSGWARTGSAALLLTDDNTVTVPWTETLFCTGNMTVYIDYGLSGDSVEQKDLPFRLDETRTWTAWKEFTVYEEPGKGTEVFPVKPGDTISLTEITLADGKIWLKCQNADNEEGWFPDAEEYTYQPSEENPLEYYEGYFKECIFAG